jgi:hypothetical protein
MDSILALLIALWVLVLLLCCGWWAACCLCGLCCPIKLQRVLAAFAALAFLISIIGTLAATHKLKEAFSVSGALLHESLAAARTARRIAEALHEEAYVE